MVKYSSPCRGGIVETAMWTVSFQFLLVVIIGSAGWAESPTPIGEIIRDPQDYHAHLVTLKGAIRQVKEGPSPIVSESGLCYGAAYFTLEDVTGSMPIEFLGVCGRGPDAAPHLSEGDGVTVYATVNWNHQYPGSVYAIGIKLSK